MQTVSGRRSFWIYYILLLFSLKFRRRIAAANSCSTLPQPTLDIYTNLRESVVLICRAPKGNHGVLFMLYRVREEVDSENLLSSAEEVQFTVPRSKGDPGQHELFCCLYKDQEGCYSAFSSYLRVENQKDAVLTPSTPFVPRPVLSVEPVSGVVKRGDMLSFSCSVPALPPQSPQSQSGYTKKPVTFLLMKNAQRTGTTSVIHHPMASQVSSPDPQPGVFTVGPVRGEDESGEYSCLYQFTKKRGLVNSTVSNVVQVTITDLLPLPTLVLQQQTDVWHLLCTGSPAYPAAVFSLYLANNELPIDTQHAKTFQHQATFPLPVQDTLESLYQCQYSVLLGSSWSHSELSHPLAVTKGRHPASSPALSGVDWPLVLGSISAVVLFLCSAAVMGVVAHRKVKAEAEKKKNRQEAQFWSRVHAKDHVVDLTLRRSSFTSEDWASGDSDTMSRSPILSSLSTFTSPIYPMP